MWRAATENETAKIWMVFFGSVRSFTEFLSPHIAESSPTRNPGVPHITMTAVAPGPQYITRDELVKRFGEMEASDGVHEYVTMKDGWKIHRETWKPTGPLKAIFLFQHGDGESTRSIGVRRLAHACLKRGFILVR